MNEKQYVNAIARKIKCSSARKKEIKKQLLTDIAMRTEQGESFEAIRSDMGSIPEIAGSFNESIPQKEQKQYFRNKILKIVIPVFLLLAALLALLYWLMPKGTELADSKYFDQEQVEAAMQHTIELLDAENYAALQESASPQMSAVLNQEQMDAARSNIPGDWGERKQFGTAYMAELSQGNAHFAVGEITVTYENASVTYRLTYDSDMRLSGLYLR